MKIQFNSTVFRDGVAVFEKGKLYDKTAEAEREVRRGNAIEVEVAQGKQEAAPRAATKPKGKGKK